MRYRILIVGFLLCMQCIFAQETHKKPWTILVYMAADNDLYPFVSLNIEQMKQVGSNDNVTILVHLDIKRPKAEKKTERYVINRYCAEPCDTSSIAMDSGAEETLYDAMQWATQSYPSDHLGVVFWNHGSGDVNAFGGIDASALFSYDAKTRSLEFDQAAAPMSLFTQPYNQHRRICYDESSLNFLDDGKIKRVFDAICKERGKNIDVVMFDACFMAGVGTLALLYPYVDYVVGSEEVVLGVGYNYRLVFQALADRYVDPRDMAEHAVQVYEKMYRPITKRYTHSAVQLRDCPELLNAIDMCAKLLCHISEDIGTEAVNDIIKRHVYNTCIFFGDGTCYVDLADFAKQLSHHVYKYEMAYGSHASFEELQYYLYYIQNVIHRIVITNVTGDDVAGAGGLSLYLPKDELHVSFLMSEFALHNTWHDFLLFHLHA